MAERQRPSNEDAAEGDRRIIDRELARQSGGQEKGKDKGEAGAQTTGPQRSERK